jgi:hypothetical protein
MEKRSQDVKNGKNSQSKRENEEENEVLSFHLSFQTASFSRL